MTQKHAIVIDDNQMNANVLAHLLLEAGLSCTEFTTPVKLEQIFNVVDDFDIVFLDLEMPGMNGYELISHLQTETRFREVPIVAYTVHVSEIARASQYGFHSFLGKPIDAEKFPDQLARILEGERVWETV